MPLVYPKDADQRWKVVENLKRYDDTEMVLIIEQHPSGKELCEIRSQTQYEIEKLISEPLDYGYEVRDVVGLEDRMRVSELGDIITKRGDRFLKQTPSDNGYLGLATKVGGRNGRDVYVRTHRAVAEAFIENPEHKPTVNHINGVKHHNGRSNLEWATYAENNRHARETGLTKPSPKGLASPLTKINTDNMKVIFELAGTISNREIGRRLGMSHTLVGDVLGGRFSSP